MSYLITQILLSLLITALLSAVAGWLIRDLQARRRQGEREEAWQNRLRKSEALAGTFKNQLAEAKQTEDNLRAELALWNTEAATETQRPSDVEVIGPLQAELVRRDKKIEMLQLQISQSKTATASEWQSIKALKSELAERQRRLEARGKQRGAERSGRLRENEEVRRKLEERVAALKRHRDHLQEELDRERRPASHDTAEIELDLEEGRGEPEEQHRKQKGHEPEAAPTAAKEANAAETDDLRKIRGIGPVLQRKLNGMGVTSFRQIASWTKKDIERIAPEVGAFPGRIRRDRWVQAARKLLREKEGAKKGF